jgi:hypothetical protein
LIHKFASKVIEKCIRGTNKAEQIMIIALIIDGNGAYEDTGIMMLVGTISGTPLNRRSSNTE